MSRELKSLSKKIRSLFSFMGHFWEKRWPISWSKKNEKKLKNHIKLFSLENALLQNCRREEERFIIFKKNEELRSFNIFDHREIQKSEKMEKFKSRKNYSILCPGCITLSVNQTARFVSTWLKERRRSLSALGEPFAKWSVDKKTVEAKIPNLSRYTNKLLTLQATYILKLEPVLNQR